MELRGKDFYLRFLIEQDAQARLDFNLRNREFLEPFMMTRADEFYTLDYQRDILKSGVEDQNEDRGYFWGIFTEDREILIGTISLTDVVRESIQAAWLGYSLDKDFNGRGLMTQAVGLVVNYAFGVLSFHRIEAGVMPHNTASIRVLEKVGFEKEGLMKKNVKINGQWEDHLHFAVINPHD